jgi:hypothetical protein
VTLFKVGSEYFLKFKVTDADQAARFMFEHGLFPFRDVQGTGIESIQVGWKDYEETVETMKRYLADPERYVLAERTTNSSEGGEVA